MKTSAQCSKCQHGQVWRIERIGVKDPQYSNGPNMPLQTVDRRTIESFPMPYDAGVVDAYVCAACGFCELYWSGLEKLQHHPKAGVHQGADPVRAAIDRVTSNVKAGDVFGCA